MGVNNCRSRTVVKRKISAVFGSVAIDRQLGLFRLSIAVILSAGIQSRALFSHPEVFTSSRSFSIILVEPEPAYV